VSGAPNPYPALGFDPAPGRVESIAHMCDTLAKARQAMDDAFVMVNALASDGSDIWQGKAAAEFRKHLTQRLPGNLRKARDSLGLAHGQLTGWHGSLLGFQDECRRLEGEAATAADRRTRAGTAADQAKADPDLKLAGQHFDDNAQLASAQQRLSGAENRLQAANQEAQGAIAEFNRLIAMAKALEDRHKSESDRVAKEVENATDHLAPNKPHKSMWDKVKGALGDGLSWVKDHAGEIGNALALVSAALAVTALIIGTGGAAAILLPMASALSGGALIAHLSDGETLKNVLHPGSAGFWPSAASLGGDLLGIVPGASVVAKGLANTAGAARPFAAAAEAAISGGGKFTGWVSEAITDNHFARAAANGVAAAADEVGNYKNAVVKAVDLSAAGVGTVLPSLDVLKDYGIIGESDEAKTTWDVMNVAVSGLNLR
jgi:hypothetical protein